MVSPQRSSLFLLGLLLSLSFPSRAFALNPQKSLTQYTRTVWTQEHGLPQDTIRAITQTSDGYLWLGTDEGLARFDGYEFTVFDKNRGQLPGNSITALAPGNSGDLWIGTASGLVHYRNGQFRLYTKQAGFLDDAVAQLTSDPDGSLWIVAGISLCHFQEGKFTTFSPQSVAPLSAVRSMYLDRSRTLWIAGYGGVAKRESGRFVPVLSADKLDQDIIVGLFVDRENNLWLSGTKGLSVLSPDGNIRKYSLRDGLPDPFVRSLWQDRDGNIWAGTNGGLARMENGRFISPAIDPNPDRDWVRSIFEDREGNLWVGMNSGLNRFRDDIFTIYSKSEGLPSDEPTTVYQDRTGHVWVGFHDAGLVRFPLTGHDFETYSTANGLPSNEVFSIRETTGGDLLLATREGFTRMHNGKFSNFIPHDPFGRRLVFDALEDRSGRIWLATSNGLGELREGKLRPVITGGALLNTSVVVLAEGLPSHLWAGTSGNGLWHLHNGETLHFTTANGLPSDQIRCLYPAGKSSGSEDAIWIGTFGGGLSLFRNGHFEHFTSKDGLLSDNIAHIEDDHRGNLWLSTTRGLCRISIQQLQDFAAKKIRRLTPTNYGVEDGLRSAQCAPGFPIGGSGRLTTDARLWIPTSRGLAVLDLNRPALKTPSPLIHLVEATSKGFPIDLTRPAKLEPDGNTIQMRYSAIYLTDPERVRYSYKLEGVDPNWVRAGNRRTINYNSLPHGPYRFLVRAAVASGESTEAAYSFGVQPHFYETFWFRFLTVLFAGAIGWSIYQMRLRQIRSRFALVLEERVRLAREIHDTLAQGFVGISSQLDAVAMCMPNDPSSAQRFLDLARRMTRHSLTEARRAVMGLRASALEGQDLAAALRLGTVQWTAGSSLQVHVDAESAGLSPLSGEMEQNLLRIAQEAVTNTLKHAAASQVWIRLQVEARKLCLRITDDGRGFAEQEVFTGTGGHFGLIGMRERAERLGGELRLESRPGNGTLVEVLVPLP